MIRGIYSTAAGMNLQMLRIDTTSNNLANISVPGFKKDRIIAVPFPSLLQLSMKQESLPGVATRFELGNSYQGVAVQQVIKDFSTGSLTQTGNPTDFALSGEGFFTVSDPADDELYYTRNGNFELDKEGYLMTSDGYRVMGEGGPIQLQAIDKVTVDNTGLITEDGSEIDTFAIVNFDDPATLDRVGGNLFKANNQQPNKSENPGLLQNYVEDSNVDPIAETVDMVTAARAYETGQKIIQAQDNMLGMAINKVGVVR